MKVVELPLDQIFPYERNPPDNQKAIGTVTASIKKFRLRQPIIGHPRRVAGPLPHLTLVALTLPPLVSSANAWLPVTPALASMRQTPMSS